MEAAARFRYVRLCVAAALSVWGTLFSTRTAYAGQCSWSSGGPYGGVAYALAISPTDPATLYAGMNSGGGIFRSTDDGATWAALG